MRRNLRAWPCCANATLFLFEAEGRCVWGGPRVVMGGWEQAALGPKDTEGP